MPHTDTTVPAPLLHFSAKPAERKVQARLMKDVFALLDEQHKKGIEPDRNLFKLVADMPGFQAIVDDLLADFPDDSQFESFEALKARRDETGIVRLA